MAVSLASWAVGCVHYQPMLCSALLLVTVGFVQVGNREVHGSLFFEGHKSKGIWLAVATAVAAFGLVCVARLQYASSNVHRGSTGCLCYSCWARAYAEQSHSMDLARIVHPCGQS